MDPATLAVMILNYNKLALGIVALAGGIKSLIGKGQDLPPMVDLPTALAEFEAPRTELLELNAQWFRDHNLPVPDE